MYAHRKATERTDERVEQLTAATAGTTHEGAVAAALAALVSCRAAQQRRLALADTNEGALWGLRPTLPDPALTGLSVDERSTAISTAADAEVTAAEELKTTLGMIRPGKDKKLKTAVNKTVSAVAAEAKAVKRLCGHVAKGEKRLFRSRKETERCSGPALVLFEGCRVRDAVLRLPGGTEIPLPTGIETADDILAQHDTPLEWKGAAHVVDVTDLAGKVTRRTEPEHRKYHVHFLCRATAPAPKPPRTADESLGTDWGVTTALVCSDGSAYGLYPNEKQQRANQQRGDQAKQLQKSMSNKTAGSRRHNQQRRRRARLIAKNTNVRVNHQLHIAKDVVTKPDLRKVVTEDTKAANMTASAVGTRAFPTRGSAAKTGLNRSILETAPARQTEFIERAAVRYSVATQREHPAYTSLTCFVCGTLGDREIQAKFKCSECCSYTHADVQASLNTNEKGNPNLYPAGSDIGGRDSRRKTLEHALGVFLDSQGVDGGVTNQYASAATVGHSRI